MSAYPIMLYGAAIRAVVVGGGEVAARKVRALLETGASVRVVAPTIAPAIETLAAEHADTLTITRDVYQPAHLRDATLVIAATDDADVNLTIAHDACEARVLVNIVDAPELGDFVTPAVHRAGDVTIAVTAGGVPAAAARIRDTIATRVDGRYATAIDVLSRLRRSLLDENGRERWRAASSTLIGTSFCDDVESGALTARVDAWR